MLNKTLIALSAAALLGSVSLASAYEAPENKLGDRFAHLDQPYAPVAAKFIGGRMVTGQATNWTQSWGEAPENKLGDRFAFFATGYAPTASGNAVRTARALPVQTAYESPENKISDRYPLLDRGYAQGAPVRQAKRN